MHLFTTLRILISVFYGKLVLVNIGDPLKMILMYKIVTINSLQAVV